MLQIRSALPADADEISGLIQSLMHPFFASADGAGAEEFIAQCQPAALAQFIARPDVAYFYATMDDEFCGVVAMRAQSHLYHLFVVPKFQGQGVGRQLWDFMLDNFDARPITLNASLNAVNFYQHLGFQTVGAVQERGGLRFVPMCWENNVVLCG
jgi:GNAT superfamily N-acetyltransferase